MTVDYRILSLITLSLEILAFATIVFMFESKFTVIMGLKGGLMKVYRKCLNFILTLSNVQYFIHRLLAPTRVFDIHEQ